MRKYRNLFGVIMLAMLFTAAYGQKNKKIAQSGFEYLSVMSDARAVALGGAVNSLEMKSSALFFNPATMAHMQETVDLSFSLNQYIADIDHNQVSVAVNPSKGQIGVFGLSYQHVNYGEIVGTRVWDNDASFIRTGTFSPSAQAIGLGYAKGITDRFAVGGQVKWTYQDLGPADVPVEQGSDSTKSIKNDLSVTAYDFGTLFKTGWKSLAFGMSVRHFSSDAEYVSESFQLPLVFTIGISMDLMDLTDWEGIDQSLILTLDATHYRSHPEQILVGLDYKLMNMISLRGGYSSSNDEEDFSFGVGVSQFGFEFDYAYTPFGVFDKVQRITARFSI
jgi:hypothetical protein